MIENRSRDRIEPNQLVVVKDIIRGEELGTIVNLHEEGFLLIGSAPVKEERVFQFMFEISEPIDGFSALAIGAESLWTKPLDFGDNHWTGFRIIDLSDEVREIIVKLISQTNV